MMLRFHYLHGVKSSLVKISCFVVALFMVVSPVISADERPDLSHEKVLYAIGTAHLDTQWNWTVKKTIDDYIKKTLDDNFSRFENYPNYNFSFEGPFRYMLMKEYYPDRYETLSGYIDQGRWHVAGTTLENGDMNVVSPESLIRQALIGNNFFEDEFGKRSTDIYLPDCFGFSYTMPTWGAHCGINGFSSQKLTWGSSVPIPFNVGVWQGPDGSSIIAALNPGAYVSNIESDLSNSNSWLDRINFTGDNYGVYADYMYFGTGDTGGAPSASSCDWLEQSIAGSGPVKVLSAGSDDLYNDITPAQKANLPVYDGELLMRIHGTGCYTSQAAMKRWNRQNELLGDSAERALVMADWAGVTSYPKDILDEIWIRFLWHSFHDDLPGTSIRPAYEISWNDEILAQNQFTANMNNAVGSFAQLLDTQVQGTPVIVYNPLGINRQDITEATVKYNTDVPDYVQVFDGDSEVPSQVLSRTDNSITIAFLADVPSVGFKVFDVRPTAQPCSLATGLEISNSEIENDQYIVSINDNGDIDSIWDKINEKELISEPVRLELLSDYSASWPAWEIRFEDIQQAPYGYVEGPAKINIVENGPVRVSLEIIRTHGVLEKSTFIQTISLTAGSAGEQVNVNTKIDWRTTGTLLKASFPLTASNSTATYDLGMGTIDRGNNKYSAYEVPAQQWADITNVDNSYGVSIFNDCRYGWDKPADNTLRLTLLHTPSVSDRYTEQKTLDIGQHELTYAIAAHNSTWQGGQIPQRAARLNQPMVSYQSGKHSGSFGREYSFVQVNNPQVFVKAVKKAQRSDEIIVRFQELYGSSASDIQVSVADGITSAREVNGCEQDVSSAQVVDGKLVFDITKYQPRTFALQLELPDIAVELPQMTFLSLPYNLDAFSWDTRKSDGDFASSLTYPAELVPETISHSGINYEIGSKSNGRQNAMYCNGQTVNLQQGDYDSLYILAASRGGDKKAQFIINDNMTELSIQDYHQNIVDWGREDDIPYLKRDTVAWIGTHRHSPQGNLAYEFCYMFQYKIDLPDGASSIILPNDGDIVIFAMTQATVPANDVIPAVETIDSLPYIPSLIDNSDTRTINLALNKPVYADTYVSSEYPALVVDGTTADNSKWCATGGSDQDHWLVLDLGQEYDVDTFVIRHAGDGGETSDWNTSAFCIQSSPDGQNNWTDLVCVEDNSDNVSTHKIIPTPLRYIRLYIANPTQPDNSNTAVRIYEFEVYGPCNGTWLTGDIAGETGGPDCKVDMYDIQQLAIDWLACNSPYNYDCVGYWLNLFPDQQPNITTPDISTAELPEDKLIAYWKAQSGSGSRLDNIADSADYGSINGASWSTGWFPQHTDTNYSLYFDGGDYVSVSPIDNSPSPNLYNLQDSISISAWIKADDWDGNRRILQKGRSDNQYRLLAERGFLVFEIYNVGYITTELPAPGVWHHVAGVYDGNSISLYVDGLERTSVQAGGKINITDDNLYIATKTPTSPSQDFFKGYLDDLRIYSVGLSPDQVRTLARQGQNAPPVIFGVKQRDSVLTSILGSSFLYSNVFDVNGDDISCQWSELSSSPDVTFSPSSNTPNTNVLFSHAGQYTIQLLADDHSGGITNATIDFSLDQYDCLSLAELGLEIQGDTNFDCIVDLSDFAVVAGKWLIDANE